MLLIDHDTVEAKNVGRQRHAYDVGHNKAVVLAQRLTAFYGVTVSVCRWRPGRLGTRARDTDHRGRLRRWSSPHRRIRATAQPGMVDRLRQ
ncbi:MAG: hypothetical protein M9930_19915 [Anaerolineae bacterium]|nr:hypothetical protein [Anaerolineae bacterium]